MSDCVVSCITDWYTSYTQFVKAFSHFQFERAADEILPSGEMDAVFGVYREAKTVFNLKLMYKNTKEESLSECSAPHVTR